MVRAGNCRRMTWGLVALLLAACGGRSIGAGDPNADGGSPPDVYVPDFPDAAVPPPDAAPGCEGSPVKGIWRGTFSGQVDSTLTGVMSVQGTMEIEIYCEESLLVHGFMEGSEASGVPFEALVEGEFDEEEGMVWATWDGTVYVIAASGTVQGRYEGSPTERIVGTWQGTAPEVSGTGFGQWMVTR